MKRFKILPLLGIIVALTLFLSGCADITIEKWIKVDKTQDEIEAKISTDYRQFYAMVKQEWEESGLDFKATEKEGIYELELPRTKANKVEEMEGDNTDIAKYTKKRNEDGTITYTFGEISKSSEKSETDSSNESEWGEELGSAMMAGYEFKWTVHFPDRVLEVKVKGSEYEVTGDDFSGRTVNLKMPLKKIPGKIVVKTR